MLWRHNTIFGNVRKNTEKVVKRYEKALRDNQYTFHVESW